MSQSLDLPDVATVWDVTEVPTIVVTQRRARRSFQKFLASKGVEVVEFDILNPRDVMEYFHDRGYLSMLWKCGGALVAASISAGVIHKAYKFVGVKDGAAKDCIERIRTAKNPEEAARMGRTMQRLQPELVRSDWDSVKIDVMYRALKSKFSIYPHLNSMLLSTKGSVLVESSPHDLFWGGGCDEEGMNYLGRLLMQLRSEFVGESELPTSSENPSVVI